MDVGSLLGGTAVGSVIGGIVITAINAFFNRRKLGADTAAVFTKAAIDLVAAQTEAVVKPLREQVHELEGEVETLRRTIRETTAELESCRAESRAKDARIRELEGTSR